MKGSKILLGIMAILVLLLPLSSFADEEVTTTSDNTATTGTISGAENENVATNSGNTENVLYEYEEVSETFFESVTNKLGTFWENISLKYDTKLLIYILLGYVCFVWISIVVWCIKDITNRTNSLLIQLFFIFIVVVGTPVLFFGLFFYLFFRPAKTILEKSFEDVDIIPEYIEIPQKTTLSKCKKCGYDKILPDFKKCPECGESLKLICEGCKKEVDPNWKVCPYCEEKLKGKDEKNKKDNKKDETETKEIEIEKSKKFEDKEKKEGEKTEKSEETEE